MISSPICLIFILIMMLCQCCTKLTSVCYPAWGVRTTHTHTHTHKYKEQKHDGITHLYIVPVLLHLHFKCLFPLRSMNQRHNHSMSYRFYINTHFFFWIFIITTYFFLSDLGYLNENGHLNLKNFEKYMEKLSEVRHIV